MAHYRNVILPKARQLFDKMRGQKVDELYTEHECMKMILSRRNYSDWVCVSLCLSASCCTILFSVAFLGKEK